MRRNGNVIMVAPTEEIAAREKLELESQKQVEELAPLHSELIQIKYAKAADLADLLKSDENRLLSERGNVTIDERTNTLLVQDTAAKLNEIRSLVEKLDIPVRVGSGEPLWAFSNAVVAILRVFVKSALKNNGVKIHILRARRT